MSVNVEVLNANVDGNGEGAVISVNEKSALYLASIGYVRIIADKPKIETTEPTAPSVEEAKPKQPRKTTK